VARRVEPGQEQEPWRAVAVGTPKATVERVTQLFKALDASDVEKTRGRRVG
jgi:hypothetical protein